MSKDSQLEAPNAWPVYSEVKVPSLGEQGYQDRWEGGQLQCPGASPPPRTVAELTDRAGLYQERYREASYSMSSGIC